MSDADVLLFVVLLSAIICEAVRTGSVIAAAMPSPGSYLAFDTSSSRFP